MRFSSLSKFCYSHIRELRCIRPYLDSETASTITAFIVHSKLDYCNSLYYYFPKSQINYLQQIQNCLARTVVKAPKSSHITSILRSLYWLRFNERIGYKLLSPTRDVTEPANIRIHWMQISCAKSVGCGCGFVARSKLPAIIATVIHHSYLKLSSCISTSSEQLK